MIEQEDAREALKTAFPFTEVTTQYVACYRTKTGKEIVLERNREDAFYIWLQKYDTEIEGVVVRNQKFPNQPYARKQPRNSNLNDKNSPKLKVGNKVWYVKVENLSSLNRLIDWYAGV